MCQNNMTLGIKLQPALFTKQAKNSRNRDTGGAQGTGNVLMGEAQVQAQTVLAGHPIVLGH